MGCPAERRSARQNRVLPGRTAFCRAEQMVISVYISYIYNLAPPGRENRSARQNGVLPGGTAFCQAERRSAGQNGVLPGRMNGNIRIYISYIYNLTPPGHENRSARQNGVLPGRTAFCRAERRSAGQNGVLTGKTNGNIRIYISPIYIIWHLRVAKIVLPGRTAFCQAERRSAGQNEL